MICRIKYKKKNQGFSIIEILVVLAIFAILFSISTSIYNSLKGENNLTMSVGSTAEALRYAQKKSQIMKDDSKWGVKISSSQVIIFSGNNFANRNVSNDQTIDLPGGITASGISEIVFDKLNGKTGDTGTITFTNNAGTKSITLNSYGTINY